MALAAEPVVAAGFIIHFNIQLCIKDANLLFVRGAWSWALTLVEAMPGVGSIVGLA
jgi:hypothetical protein